MKTALFTTLMLVLQVGSLYSQSGSINNTLGTDGLFVVKDGSTAFLSLSQSDGYLSLNRSLTLPITTSSTLGVIFKGTNRFIHDYQAAGTDGFNTFVGVNSGNFTMSGGAVNASSNTAVGNSSLASLTTGYQNSAFGRQSLYSNTSGRNNSALGRQSLNSNTSGYDNSAFGYQSLAFNTTGNLNSAFGYSSLYFNTGNSNSAFGWNAGYTLTTGSNNTLIGYNAQPSTFTVSNQITLGDANITSLRCNVQTITALSDARDKKSIRDLPLGLDFLMSVKPRLFNWDRREWYEDGKADGSKMQEEPTAGFIAQELDEAQTNAEAEWLNLVLKSNPEKLEATSGNLLPIMVKAIQELNEKLARYEHTQRLLLAQIERLKSEHTTAVTQVR